MRADDTPCKKKIFSFRCGLAGSVHQETMDSSVPSIYEHYIVVIFCSEWTIRDWSTMFVARGIPNTNVYGTRPFEGMTCEKICVVDEFRSVCLLRNKSTVVPEPPRLCTVPLYLCGYQHKYIARQSSNLAVQNELIPRDSSGPRNYFVWQ